MSGTKPPPLSVHVVWSPESEQGLAPKAGKALFDYLNFTVSNEKQIQPGAGIPVYLGTHLDLIEQWRGLCYPPKLQAAKAPEPASDLDLPSADEVAAENRRPCMIVVPMLDREARIDERFDRAVLEWMQFIQKHQPHCNANLLLLPVPLTRSWLSRIPDAIPPCRSAVWLSDSEAQLKAIEEEVSLEICHFLMDRAYWGGQQQPRNRVRIFISHAKSDLDATGHLAIDIRNHLATTGLKSFFDLNDVARGRDLEQQLRAEQRNAIFLAIHTDRYADSPYCLEEILVAKKYGVPLVVVSALASGESRRPTYGGNTQVFVYQPTDEDESFNNFITSRCLVAWLKHLHFHHAARYAESEARFAVKPEFISRPPELLDFAHGLLPSRGPCLVFHPDPPLPLVESTLLKKANPKLRLLTPTTTFGNDLARNPAPLFNGYRVGLSLSSSPDLPDLDTPDHRRGCSRQGLVDSHYMDVINLLTMSLIRGGASLGYGGHLQSMGFSHFLAKLIGDHKRTNKSAQDLLYSYVVRYMWESLTKEESEDIDAKYLRCGDPLVEADEDVRRAIQLSQMRMKIGEECFFRIILGGKTSIRGADDRAQPHLTSAGFSGMFPGQAEEAWHSIEQRLPLYIIGAFGGAARQVADALQGKEVADAAALERRYYDDLAERYRACRSGLAEELRSPDSLDSLWERFRDAGRGWFDGTCEDEHEAIWINGLSVADNRILFESFNPTQVVELILKGMQRAIKGAQHGKRIDDLVLFNGSIVDTPDVDAYAVAVMEGAPLKGADGALDASLDGALRRYLESRGVAEADKVNIFSTRDSGLVGDWVLLYKTTGFATPDGDERKTSSDERMQAFAAKLEGDLSEILNKADDSGISSLAMVLFGTNMGANFQTSVDAVLRAIQATDALKTLKTLVLCEYDTDRYAHLCEILRLTPDGEKTISAAYRALTADADGRAHVLRVAELPPSPPADQAKRTQSIVLDIRNPEKGKIVCYAQTAGSGVAVSLQDTEVEWKDVMKLVHNNKGRPPARTDQVALGIRLAQLVLPESIAAMIRRHPDRPVDVFHDVGTAALPFELFRFQPENGKTFSPSAEGGLRRRLLAKGLMANQRAYKRTFPIRVLLVTNPTADLRAAQSEGQELKKLLAQFPDVALTHLSHDTKLKATKNNVLKELAKGYTIFHFAGHAKYDPEPGRSGLVFPGNHRLTAEDLDKYRVQENPPAIAVINACESAAMSSRTGDDPALATGVTFAERFLRCGMHAYIGNIWEVEDRSAKIFSEYFYADVLGGKSLGDGVLGARRKLKASTPDWCNYVLYGDADFRI